MYEPICLRILNLIETLKQPQRRINNDTYLGFQFWTSCKDSEEHNKFILKCDFKAGGDYGASTTRRKVSAAVPGATTGIPRVASQTKQNKKRRETNVATVLVG